MILPGVALCFLTCKTGKVTSLSAQSNFIYNLQAVTAAAQRYCNCVANRKAHAKNRIWRKTRLICIRNAFRTFVAQIHIQPVTHTLAETQEGPHVRG